MTNDIKIYKGLNGIYVDETSICKVDGANGTLSYRGVMIEDLVKHDFQDVAYLLLFDRFPNADESLGFENFLIANGQLNKDETAILSKIPQNLHPMKMLQAMVPLLSLDSIVEHDYDAELANGLVVAAKIPSLIADYHNLCIGKKGGAIVKGLSFNANFLQRFTGELPQKIQTDILNVTQILQMEHSFNASTYASLVTASSLAPVECAISSGIGTLYGKLHGGADQAALEMAMAIDDVADVENFILNRLKNKQKIMGMGHRVYRVLDPRAKILKPMAKALCSDTPFDKTYKILEEIERVMQREMLKKGKDIRANVEFYKGPVLYALGIPVEYFTAIFAMSRVFGYLAHILASRENNMLIRPKALYVGR